jgi:transposase InsO family protein
MSQTISPDTGKAYGVERVCHIWEQARSSFYHRTRQDTVGTSLKRRGPPPSISDEALLALIRTDLATTPFAGEGHRKVWARLRVRDGVRVARKRVLRLMRENHLLSPHRSRPKPPKAHDGKIITLAPNLMWGTDGTRVFTLEDGWVWIFTAVDHWNAECVGWHVCKTGDRYAALQPISMALSRLYGSVERGIARGLSLRMDHGTQYLSDHFLNQIKFWGLTPSFAFVAEPQTNGVAERFNRTLKEQAIYGRVFRTVAEVRDAVKTFVDLYNGEWRVEKNAFRSPDEIRQAA